MENNRAAFLELLSSTLKQQHGHDLYQVACVFPNRRAGVYFRKFLAAGAAQPIWSPAIFSIEDFIVELTRLRIAEDHQLLLLLYDVYQGIEQEKSRDLDDFLNWAPALLDDFSEIDLYLADPAGVFNYLREARDLSQWSPDAKELTDFQKSYLHFYHSLQHYYTGLKERMESGGLVSKAHAYRQAASRIQEFARGLRFKKVVFAGFNALTRAEERIITYLRQAGLAEVYWDADKYYMEQDIQEAGRFLRGYKARPEFGEFRWEHDHFRTIAKNIQVIGVPLHVAQAKAAGQIIGQMGQAEQQDTALVLGDENMLIPMLNSLPENLQAFNVTMGLPLKLTPVFPVFDKLFLLHLRGSAAGQDGKAPVLQFYFKDLLGFFRNPLVNDLIDQNDVAHRDSLKTRENELLKQNFFTAAELLEKIIPPHPGEPYPMDFITNNYKLHPIKILDACQRLIVYLKDRIHKQLENEDTPRKKHSLSLEYLYAFSVLFSQLKETWQGTGIPFSLHSLHKLFRQSVQKQKLSFYGEPLLGMQIMGMLETRNLDFKNLIILHVNDDVLPSGKHSSSFIPFDIREHFHLPTYRDKQAVFAYHFYRLLQRAENVYLLYNTEPGQMAGGGRSRFILQIENELTKNGCLVHFEERLLSFPSSSGQAILPIVINKDDFIRTKLQERNQKGWSASSLNKYRICPLRFYFSVIKGIEEAEEPLESMDAATLGTAFHTTMEQLYAPYLGKDLDPGAFDEMMGRIPAILPVVFTGQLETGDIHSGKNLLLVEAAKVLINKYLSTEKNAAEARKKKKETRQLLYTEKSMSCSLDNYKLIGIADRVDRQDGRYVILDYKTGKLEDNELRLKDFDEFEKPLKTEKAFQLLMYAYLLYHSLPDQPASLNAGIVSLRQPDRAMHPLVLSGETLLTPVELRFIEDHIRQILSDIHDDTLPFRQTDQLDACRYCAYQSICIR